MCLRKIVHFKTCGHLTDLLQMCREIQGTVNPAYWKTAARNCNLDKDRTGSAVQDRGQYALSTVTHPTLCPDKQCKYRCEKGGTCGFCPGTHINPHSYIQWDGKIYFGHLDFRTATPELDEDTYFIHVYDERTRAWNSQALKPNVFSNDKSYGTLPASLCQTARQHNTVQPMSQSTPYQVHSALYQTAQYAPYQPFPQYQNPHASYQGSHTPHVPQHQWGTPMQDTRGQGTYQQGTAMNMQNLGNVAAGYINPSTFGPGSGPRPTRN